MDRQWYSRTKCAFLETPEARLHESRQRDQCMGGGSGIAAPSFLGSEAPKFTPVEKFRSVAWPPPMIAA